jgi:opacity protein-like surface antigen
MKNLILFLAAFMAASAVYSQVSMGIKGGMQTTGINGTYNAHGYEITEIMSNWQPRFGLDLAFPFSEKFAFCTGLDYSVQGFDYRDEENDWNVTFSGTNTYKYLEVPLTLKMNVLKSRLLYFRSGFYLSFLLSAHSKGSITYNYPDQFTKEQTDEEIMDEMNKTLLGYLVAAGLEIPLTKKLHLLTEIAYRIDLMPAMTDEPPNYFWKSTIDYYATRSDVRNRMASLTLGLTYNLD